MYRKPSTIIAGAIREGWYVDENSMAGTQEGCSQFMCHAIENVATEEMFEKTVHLIEEKLKKMGGEELYGTYTLHTALIRVNGWHENAEVPHEVKLKFWREFIKELKAKGL